MKVAVASTGKTLEDRVDQRLGRAKYFLIVDTSTNEVKVVPNIQNLNLSHGAGIQAGQTITKEKVEALITGNCGPNAFKVLKTAGIKVYTGMAGTVKKAMEEFNSGKLTEVETHNVEGHG